MAKITRYNGNLEAPASAALGTERTIFGTGAQSDDLTDQFNAFLLRGWGIVGPSDQPTLQDFNAMGFTLGQIHAYLHQMGVAEYNALQEYHTGSFTNVAGVLYVSRVDDNVGNPPASSPVQWRSADQLDSIRIDVASATNVNLTTSAPNTRNINITGTTTITGFTVEAGKTYFVRFAGALTLTNGAGLVTQTGANILTASGDTCIIRATAANTVEVMVYVDATVQSLTTNGHRKFKDGMIIQWLTVTHTAGKNVAQVFALPETFPNAALSAVVLDISTTSSRPVIWSSDILSASSISMHWTFGDLSSATATRTARVLLVGH